MSKPFAKATGDRVKITNEQRRLIRNMYLEASKDVAKKAEFYKNRDNISSIMRTQYLGQLRDEIETRMKEIDTSTESMIKDNMRLMCQSVIQDNDKLLKDMGFATVKTANLHITADAVNHVMSGKLYEGKWSLSKAIWTDNAKKLSEIDTIIAKGIAEQKTTYEIAKDLERYVSPRARKDWSWSKVYPGSRKVIDYSAQRLARTMVSHAYAESFVRTTKDNPFIEAYRWISSGSDRMCPVCEERDGNIYAKDDLPLDHPNGMCTFEIVLEKSYEEIGSCLADWVNGEGDQELNKEIDRYAESLYNRKTNGGELPKSLFVNSRINQIADNKNIGENAKVSPATSGASREISREQYLDMLGTINADTAKLISEADPRDNIVAGVNKLSKAWNITPEEARAILTKETQRIYNENGVAIRIDKSVLANVLDEGFKNQFQTNSSNGALSFDTREVGEKKVFNLPYNFDRNYRPVYGSIMPTKFDTVSAKEYVLNGDSSMYGDTIVYLKKEMIANNATLTWGDSLNERGLVKGTPLNDISVQTLGIDPFYEIMSLKPQGFEGQKLEDIMATGNYIEVQVYGEKSKSPDCIDKIVFTNSDPDDNIKTLLSDRGIKWETLKDEY